MSHTPKLGYAIHNDDCEGLPAVRIFENVRFLRFFPTFVHEKTETK